MQSVPKTSKQMLAKSYWWMWGASLFGKKVFCINIWNRGMKLRRDNVFVYLLFSNRSPSSINAPENAIEAKISLNNCYSVLVLVVRVESFCKLKMAMILRPMITSIEVTPLKKVRTEIPECQLIPFLN